MQAAGILLILLGLLTKCAALLASIPEPIVGGVLGMGMVMVTGVALSNLQVSPLLPLSCCHLLLCLDPSLPPHAFPFQRSTNRYCSPFQ